jgi:hypothetical protein
MSPLERLTCEKAPTPTARSPNRMDGSDFNAARAMEMEASKGLTDRSNAPRATAGASGPVLSGQSRVEPCEPLNMRTEDLDPSPTWRDHLPRGAIYAIRTRLTGAGTIRADWPSRSGRPTVMRTVARSDVRPPTRAATQSSATRWAFMESMAPTCLKDRIAMCPELLLARGATLLFLNAQRSLCGFPISCARPKQSRFTFSALAGALRLQ